MKINPKDMERAMKQMGIKSENVEALEVLIKCKDKELVIESPSVQKVTMAGQESFQITGAVRERSSSKFTEDDVKLVSEQAGVDEALARDALEKAKGDIAAAIMELKG
ncbi:MAG: nascent polypeptide-associated complex protein [Candidatus Aenigmatarchaeota archaeon]|nr:MAG: nascent polypeptide-associated complex protein [Candidatus Aenigmarchaeota archaeon]